MDFYKNPNIIYKWNVAILVACILLTLYGLYQLFFTESHGYLGMVTPILLGIGMSIEIRKYRRSKKASENNENSTTTP